MKTMNAFHNDPEIKRKYLERVAAHEEMDEIIKGQYWEDGKGCAVGCTVHSDSHSAFEYELGIPNIIAHLEDFLFESIPNDLAKTWPRRFLEAIPVGKDLSKVWVKFAIYLLTDSSQCASKHPQCDVVANAFRAELNGVKQNWAEIAAVVAAAANATSAAAAATVADIAAAVAASVQPTVNQAAYFSAVEAAESDACATGEYDSDAYAYAKELAYINQSEKLLELLAE